jgi:hypothetical protein
VEERKRERESIRKTRREREFGIKENQQWVKEKTDRGLNLREKK